MREYLATVQKFPGRAADALRGRFEMLCEVGNLFVVRPASIRGLIEEGPHLGCIDPQLVVPYLTLRTDYTSAGISLIFPDLQQSFSRLRV